MSVSKIDRAAMFESLLAADPGFAPQWDAFVAEWAGEPDPPLYLALLDLADHLVERLEHGDTAALGNVFVVIEQWVACGDEYVRKAAVTGLLEELQKARGSIPAEIERRLLPQSRSWWDRLYRFWDGDAGALREDS